MTTDVAVQGQQLIQEMKEHIVKAMATHPRGKKGVSVSELQDFSGLTIKGYGGGEVWTMGVITLLIELMKVGRIYSEVTSLNTRYWKGTTKIWLS